MQVRAVSKVAVTGSVEDAGMGTEKRDTKGNSHNGTDRSGSGRHPNGRRGRRAAGVASPSATRTSRYRLDARTRAIGLAGVAEARATLAACHPPDVAHSEDDLNGSEADGSTGVDPGLSEAA